MNIVKKIEVAKVPKFKSILKIFFKPFFSFENLCEKFVKNSGTLAFSNVQWFLFKKIIKTIRL